MTKTESWFLMLEYTVLDSDAFVNLSSVATRILLLLLRRYNGRNNDQISLGVREAATWCHCGLSTAHRALAELQGSKLITETDKGRLVRSGDNRATRWRLNFVKQRSSSGTKERSCGGTYKRTCVPPGGHRSRSSSGTVSI